MLPSTVRTVTYGMQLGLRLCRSPSTASELLAAGSRISIDSRPCHAEHKEDIVEAIGLAFNHIEKKKGLYKPTHSIQEQIAYMKSKGGHIF